MRKTILIVEDDAAVREGIQLLLEMHGYAVVAAFDGLEALTKLDGCEPSLVLLDLTMPRLGGRAVAEEMDRRGLRPKIPIIVLSAAGSSQDTAKEIGAEGFLRKPFDNQVLLREVARWTAG